MIHTSDDGNETREAYINGQTTMPELSLKDLEDILSTTIFEDRETKLILFLACLLTFTDSEQVNAMVTGESSIGKTYTINEVLWYFRKLNCILRFDDATPKSFIHKASAKLIDGKVMQQVGMPREIDLTAKPKIGDSAEKFAEWYELLRNSAFYLDYQKRIIVFPDAPDSRLLKPLRPLASHDTRIAHYEVTDKSSKGMRTKIVYVNGFFTIIYASASTLLDEQEVSRNFLLSPSDDPKKIDKSLELIARRNSDVGFSDWHEKDPQRVALAERVKKIKDVEILQIFIPDNLMANLKDWFTSKVGKNPKVQRDFPRLIALAKAWALLNYEHRNKTPNDVRFIYCNETDIEVAKSIYEPLLISNELGLTPEEYSILQLIEPLAGNGLSISEIHSLYFSNKKRPIGDNRLRGILKNFCRAGKLREEKDGHKLKYYSINQDSGVKLAD